MASLSDEISSRRTFAIISHPDAGKTTLTEKLLLYTGSIQTAGLAGIHSAQCNGRLDGRVVQAGRRCRKHQHGHSQACCKQTCEKTFFHRYIPLPWCFAVRRNAGREEFSHSAMLQWG